MKFKLSRMSFLVIFIAFISYSIQLFKNFEFNAMFCVYLFLSEAISDICFAVKQSGSEKIRAVYWTILNAMVGILLGMYSFINYDKLLSSVIIIWAIFTTITNIILIKKASQDQ